MDKNQPTRLSLLVAVVLGSLMGLCITSLPQKPEADASEGAAVRQVDSPASPQAGHPVQCARK